MFGKPDYENPTPEDLNTLTYYDNKLEQVQKLLGGHGQFEEVRVIKRERQLVRNRKICTRAALNLAKQNYVNLSTVDELPSII